jgi:hypothetical protein
MTAGMDYLRGDTGGALGALFGAAKGAFQQKRGEQRTRSEKTSAADVIMWSGCKDSQTVSTARCHALIPHTELSSRWLPPCVS